MFCLQATGKVIESTDHNPIYTQGCMKAVGTFINDHAITIGGVMLGVLLPQVQFLHNLDLYMLFEKDLQERNNLS